MTPQQLFAWRSALNGADGYYFVSDKTGKYFRGVVSIYEQGSNVGARILMRKTDLGPDQ